MKHTVVSKRICILIISLLITAKLFSQTLPSYIPANGLVAWYPFTGNAVDSSGNGNDGTVNGAMPTTDRFGNVNSAYSFNGATNYINGSCSAFPTADRTVSLWFYGTNIGTSVKGKSIFGYGGIVCGTSWLEMFGLPAHPDAYEVSGHCDAHQVLYGFGSNAPNNAWHNWIITNSSLGIKFYIDGQLVVSSTTYPNNTYVAGKDFVIGGIPGADGTGFSIDVNQEPLQGKIDDVAIYSRALSACEIHQLYTGSTLALTSQPASVNVSIGDSAQFIVSTMDTSATYQWQIDSTGTDFQNISDSGQFSGTTNDTLWVNTVTPGNNNQQFRCVVSFQGFCTDTSLSAPLIVKVQYIFNGSGNWDINANWISNTIPPAALPSNAEILINPAGNSECVLNVAQTILAGAKITVMAGKKLRITGDLTINQ